MKLEGILRVESNYLVFEFQKKDAVFEAYKSELKEVKIPVSEISMIEYKKGLFSSKLIIHAERPSTFQEFPGSELTERKLKVKRKHRETAANISSKINLELSEYRLEQLKGEDE